MSKKNKKIKKKQVDQTMELVRSHLFDIIDHPEKLNRVPEQSTLVLFPVPVKTRKAA